MRPSWSAPGTPLVGLVVDDDEARRRAHEQVDVALEHLLAELGDDEQLAPVLGAAGRGGDDRGAERRAAQVGDPLLEPEDALGRALGGGQHARCRRPWRDRRPAARRARPGRPPCRSDRAATAAGRGRRRPWPAPDRWCRRPSARPALGSARWPSPPSLRRRRPPPARRRARWRSWPTAPGRRPSPAPARRPTPPGRATAARAARPAPARRRRRARRARAAPCSAAPHAASRFGARQAGRGRRLASRGLRCSDTTRWSTARVHATYSSRRRSASPICSSIGLNSSNSSLPFSASVHVPGGHTTDIAAAALHLGGHAADDGDRELEALGGVHRHDPHGVVVVLGQDRVAGPALRGLVARPTAGSAAGPARRRRSTPGPGRRRSGPGATRRGRRHRRGRLRAPGARRRCGRAGRRASPGRRRGRSSATWAMASATAWSAEPRRALAPSRSQAAAGARATRAARRRCSRTAASAARRRAPARRWGRRRRAAPASGRGSRARGTRRTRSRPGTARPARRAPARASAATCGPAAGWRCRRPGTVAARRPRRRPASPRAARWRRRRPPTAASRRAQLLGVDVVVVVLVGAEHVHRAVVAAAGPAGVERAGRPVARRAAAR